MGFWGFGCVFARVFSSLWRFLGAFLALGSLRRAALFFFFVRAFWVFVLACVISYSCCAFWVPFWVKVLGTVLSVLVWASWVCFCLFILFF